jgi:hypothetical protein
MNKMLPDPTIAHLQELRSRGARDDLTWKTELATILRSTPLLHFLLTTLDRLELSISGTCFDDKIITIVDSALAELTNSTRFDFRHPSNIGKTMVAADSQTGLILRWYLLFFISLLGAALIEALVRSAARILSLCGRVRQFLAAQSDCSS